VVHGKGIGLEALTAVHAVVVVAREDLLPSQMKNLPSRRNLFEAAQRYLLEPDDEQLDKIQAEPPRLTSQAIQKVSMSRSRERILANLDDMYREAFERAKTTSDANQLATLDFAYRREQLYFEILLDVRDALERGK
jgi:hypothetical protein